MRRTPPVSKESDPANDNQCQRGDPSQLDFEAGLHSASLGASLVGIYGNNVVGPALLTTFVLQQLSSKGMAKSQ